MKKKTLWMHRGIVGLLIGYLLLPILVTFLYSVATAWYHSILPEGYTLKWYGMLFSNMRFWEALGRSFLVSIIPIVLCLMMMLLAIFAISIYFPQYEKLLQSVVLLPYAIPGVVLAISLIRLYATSLGNSIGLLVFAYTIFIIPYMYQGIRNSLRTINIGKLVEAAELLGATKIQAFKMVILPNILPGIQISMLLSFSVLFGEFTFVNLLLGGNYETVQMYLYKMLSESGHVSSALVVTFFTIVLIISYIVLRLTKSIEVKKVHG
ncbi:ABC transporter permease subunit [Clostridiaceae bacterium 35-E11]